MTAPTRTEGGLIVEVRDRVAYATLDRLERLNALSVGLTNDLVDAFDSFSNDPGIWAVLLSATGDRAFSAGADLKEMGGRDAGSDNTGGADARTAPRGRRGVVPMTGSRRNFFEVVMECSKPTVAAVFGWAMGGGCELALACDVRIAADDLRIGMPEAKRGLGANFGSVVLPRVVPIGLASHMLYTGEPLDAQESLRWGLVHSVVPRDELAARAEMLAPSKPRVVPE
ncbi:MAG: enoyl-CoA hydratase/isomerase family protein [Actinomycetota bacterium]|nr:enoyl-CoA hydratase/isomerase family protein [Actinomycetota bacterium]